MKNSYRILSCSIIVFFAFLSFQQIGYAQSVYIETDDLLVREGAGTTYDLIGHVNEGETYPLIEETDDWFAIEYNGQTGWVSKQFSSIADSEDTNDANVVDDDNFLSGSIKIPVNLVNLRAAATTESDIIRTLSKNEEIMIIGQANDDWVEVQIEDATGFIPLWIVSIDQDQIKMPAPILKDKVIVIDPGHGGYDVGAISITDNYESEYVITTAQTLKHHLERLGAEVYLTRDNDFYYFLSARPALANYLEADIFISLHYNSEPQYPTANGMNTFYYHGADQDLAQVVHQSLINETGANDREL